MIKAENGRLKEQMVEKEYQLQHIKIEVDHMKDRIIETKERLLDIEKTKEKLFHETIISYKRQLDESDALWIASHFADIDGNTKQKEKTEEAPAVYAQPNHVETILEDVTKQIHVLQKQLTRAQSSDKAMSQTIEGLKNRAAEEKPYQKWVYKLNLEKENKPSQKKPNKKLLEQCQAVFLYIYSFADSADSAVSISPSKMYWPRYGFFTSGYILIKLCINVVILGISRPLSFSISF